MQHSEKYLIHAELRTSGVVEQSDVVGAIFGQTEGLLGDELDMRDLQESSKVGRIDVDIDSEDGRSFGTFTVASSLDRVKTAVLAAALETIDRVGPCRADCTVTHIEDARAAKRREVIDRATELLAEFEDTEMAGEALVKEVRKQARVEELTEYEGLPAGPRVATSDAIIIVEGRADVRQLLEYGIRNAVAVEGTDVPDAVARLTVDRKATAFLDGDRGGDLILQELQQVGDVDYVAFAPAERSVEDLDRAQVTSALRKKVPCEQIGDGVSAREAFAPTDGGTIQPADGNSAPGAEQSQEAGNTPAGPTGEDPAPPEADSSSAGGQASVEVAPDTPDGTESDTEPSESEEPDESVDDGTVESDPVEHPRTLPGHVTDVVAESSGVARLLDTEFECLEEVDAGAAFDAIADTETVPHTVVVDGTVTQRLLDVAAQRGVGQVVGTDAGEFVKQPTSVRVRTATEFS